VPSLWKQNVSAGRFSYLDIVSIDSLVVISSKENQQMRKKIREGAVLGVLLSSVLYGGMFMHKRFLRVNLSRRMIRQLYMRRRILRSPVSSKIRLAML